MANKPTPHNKHQNFQKFSKYFNFIYDKSKLILYTLLVILLLGCSLGLGIGFGYFSSVASSLNIPSKEAMNKTLHKGAQKSTMTYYNGEPIATLHSDIVRTNVDMNEISPNVINALISVEDPNFYKHDGVVPKSILRALIGSATGLTSQSGGSTLTQQLVKQQFLSSQQTLNRKVKELLLSLRVEKYFSKNDILTTYLNISSFGRNNKGQNIAGIQEAAMGIFGVNASDLSIPQAAYLAGLPQSPIVYSPYTATGELKSDQDLSYGLERKNIVLESMYRNNKISYEEYLKAKNYDLKKDFLPTSHENSNNGSYLYFAIRNEAIAKLMPNLYEKDGYTAEDLEQSQEKYQHYYQLAEEQLSTGGYNIQSTIDPQIYNAMQKAAKQYGSLLDQGKNKTVQVGNILMNNQTGHIYGFVSGRDYSQNQNDHAFQTKRSPASTMKPIIAYAPAIDVGLINTETMLNDFSFNYSESKKSVTNFGKTTGNKFESVKEALMHSDNIPVAHLYQTLLTRYNPYTYMKNMNMGLTDREVHYESAPLGTNNVSVNAQTGAYATLANNGKYNEPYLIEKITDSSGNVIYQHTNNQKQVFKPETASIMNYLMREVVKNDKATGYPAYENMKKLNEQLANADWVGKTGTSDAGTDYWFIASTPKITLSSWIGYDDNSVLPDNSHDKSMEYWAKLAYSIEQTNSSIMGLDQKFELLPTVKEAEVSDKTGTKFGKFNYGGTEYEVKGNKVKAYAVTDSAFQNPTYRFGIGGTLQQYNNYWTKDNK